MKVFYDTSTLFKLYVPEEGTAEILDFVENNPISVFYVSEIAKTEFNSAVAKRLRMGFCSDETAIQLMENFKNDYGKYSFIPLNQNIVFDSSSLIKRYRTKGLRTLDAIQLASALQVKNVLGRALTSDNTLKSIMETEGLATDF